MRRRILALSAVLVAAGLITSISLFLVPGASPAGAQDSGDFVSQGSISPGPGLPEEDFPPYSQVVDDASNLFSAPGWEVRSTNPDGYKVDYHIAGGTEPAQFTVQIPATDVYSVYAWWPTSVDNSIAAYFDITTTSGVQRTEAVSQQEVGGMWVKLGEYEMAAGDGYIQVSPHSGDGSRVVADAVAVVRGVQTAPPEDGTIDGAGGGRPTGRDVVRVARRYIGTDYKWGTCTSRQMSCACLTKVVYSKFGQKLPFSEDRQWKYGRRVSPRKPGDLVFFREKGRRAGITHVGIYAGNGELVHASSWFDEVVESRINRIDGYIGARRLKLR